MAEHLGGESSCLPRNKTIAGYQFLPLDYLAVFNGVLFSIMCWTVYWRRFLEFKGEEALPEFMVYAAFIYAGILVAWWALRRHQMPWRVLLGLECAILLHFIAGLIMPNGMRLYDHTIGPIRYDKIVHWINSVIGCYITLEIFKALEIRIQRGKLLVVVLVVLGVGAVIEILEYAVSINIPRNGVGDYDNNMQDLVANLTGGLCFSFWHILFTRSKQS